MKTYPAVVFVSRHGRKLALVVAILLAIASVACFAAGCGIAGLVGGLVLAGIAWAALRIFAELVEVIAETLLPR